MKRLALILALVLTAPTAVYAQLTPAPAPVFTALDNSGRIVSLGKLCVYVAGSSTPATTYSDNTGTPNTNPVKMDSAGRATIFLQPGASYKFELRTPGSDDTCSTGTVLWTRDGLNAVPTSAGNIDVLGTAGATLNAGTVAYLSKGDGGLNVGQWYPASSAAPYSSTTLPVGMVPTTIAAGASGTIRIGGRITGLSSLSVGVSYYVAASAGTLTTTAPIYKRLVGVADSVTSLVLNANQPDPIPIGTIVMFGAATAPPGWLLCEGQSLLRADYPGLFSVIGTTYGSADGTHFTLPDLRQRFPMGVAASGTGNALGATGGAIDHTHTTTATTGTPSATVDVQSGSGTTVAKSDHTHTITTAATSTNNPPFLALSFVIKQ